MSSRSWTGTQRVNPQSHLDSASKGMSASLAPECNEVKDRYDSCFLKWYSEKYLRGNSVTDECEPLFKKYKECLTKALKDRGIDKMLEEAREDNNSNDADSFKWGSKS